MPRKPPIVLPDPLRYLQPFARSLAKLEAAGTTEDADGSRLDRALRKRLRGLDEAAADDAVARDRGLLEDWLNEGAEPGHPGRWIVGYLTQPGLGALLVRPAGPPPRGPAITFDTPQGWKVKAVPFRLDLAWGEVTGSVTAIDRFSHDVLRAQRGRPVSMPAGWPVAPGLDERSELLEVRVGEVEGIKHVYRMFAPSRLKRVEYLLGVPGGFVSVTLDSPEVDFDETPFEEGLGTLRISGGV